MITLTTPPQINSILGGNAPIAYNKLVVGPFTFTPSNQDVTGQIALTSTAQPDMAAITGTLKISVATAKLEVSVPQLDFYRRVTLTGPQNTAVQNIVRDAQNALEAGLVSLGVIAGVQSTGA